MEVFEVGLIMFESRLKLCIHCQNCFPIICLQEHRGRILKEKIQLSSFEIELLENLVCSQFFVLGFSLTYNEKGLT